MGEELLAGLSMVGSLLLMIAVFVGAYFVSKWVAKKYNAPGTTAAGNIEILDRTAIGRDQYIMLVKVAGKGYLIGATPQQIQKIEEVDLEQIVLRKPEDHPSRVDFMSVLKDAVKKQVKK